MFTLSGGTLAGAQVVQGSPVNPFFSGKLGDAVNLDGAGENVSVSDPTDNHLDIGANATMEAWVRFDALPNNTFATILSKDEGGGNTNKWIFGYARNYSGIANATMLLINTPSGGDGSAAIQRLDAHPWPVVPPGRR